MRATGVYTEQLVGIDCLEEGVLQLECQVAEAGAEALRGHETGLIGEFSDALRCGLCGLLGH